MSHREKRHHHHAHHHSRLLPPLRPSGARSGAWWVRAWWSTWALTSGILALAWLILRSGNKPSRLAYPCQQAALSAATLAFGAPLVAVLFTLRDRVRAGLSSPSRLALAAFGLLLCLGLWGSFSPANSGAGPQLPPPPDYRAQVFHVTNCPQDPVGAHFPGVDNMLLLMGYNGVKFYRSATETVESGPDGIIASDDVVAIKINYQWDQRGGTNVDVLHGLIERITQHPDGFSGEIVVCENAQFNSVNNFDRAQNNAQDHSLSPHDVVMEYQAHGFDISHFDWTSIRNILVTEYSTGNMNNGYIRYNYNPQLQGRVSYPKFQTAYGTYISLRLGLFDPIQETYDREHLKFINIPVLKSHHATYGATSCVKHYMGVVTGALSTNSHSAIQYGILGALIGEIQLADLNLLDCIWINANPYGGPWTTYNEATRRDELVACIDPVAADIWAVKNILIPAFIDNGYNPPWPYPSADPDNPNSAFRRYLDNSMEQILAAGYDVTNDLAQIDLLEWDGVLGDDCNANGIPDGWELTDNDCNTNGVPDECDIANGTSQDQNGDGIPDECCYPYVRGEVNGDGVIDLADPLYLLDYLFGSGPSPQPVLDAGDSNNDDVVDLGDAVYLLAYLFGNGPAPPPPFPDPGCE